MFVSCSISQIGSPHEEAKVPLKISLEGRAACGGLCAAATSAMTHQMGWLVGSGGFVMTCGQDLSVRCKSRSLGSGRL